MAIAIARQARDSNPTRSTLFEVLANISLFLINENKGLYSEVEMAQKTKIPV